MDKVRQALRWNSDAKAILTKWQYRYQYFALMLLAAIGVYPPHLFTGKIYHQYFAWIMVQGQC